MSIPAPGPPPGHRAADAGDLRPPMPASETPFEPPRRTLSPDELMDPSLAADRLAPPPLPRQTAELMDPSLAADRLAPPPLPRQTGWDSAPPNASTISTNPPKGKPRSVPAAAPPLEIPAALGPSDAVRVLARLIRARYSGSLALENGDGIRRVVLLDGDFVTAASGVEGESLVAFLVQRGALAAEVGTRLGRKLPPFGRHAGAALVAHGHLRQDELWPVLRAHAEWVIGHALSMTKGVASLEQEIPARLQGEPAGLGRATGSEVLVEMVRRFVSPAATLALLGGPDARLVDGPEATLLGECSLPEHEVALVTRTRSSTVQQVVDSAHSPDFATVLYALCELQVLRRMVPSATPPPAKRTAEEPVVDMLDDTARRTRIEARQALVQQGDYFALLGLPLHATGYEIRHAYLELRREFEPSRMLTAGTADLRDQVDEIVSVLEEAYEILKDQVRRERYRRALEASP
jgi:hypothetical protein